MTHAKFKKTKKNTSQYKPFVRKNRERIPFKERIVMMFAPWLPYVLAVLLLAFAYKAWQLIQSPIYFPLRHVEVQANYQHVSQTRLKAAMSDALKGGFFSLNVDHFQKQVKTELPWVQSISVKRVWPNRIKVIVTEKQAIATWNHDTLITNKGTIFSPPAASFPKGLVALNGPGDQLQAVLAEYLDLRDQLQPLNLSVTNVTMTDRGAWHVALSNGVELLLGRENVDARMARLVAVYPTALAPNVAKIKAIDLRYPNGFAVAWIAGHAPKSV